jgi:hypothetical protein
MKKILLFFVAVVLLCVNVLHAQTPQYYINTGTGGNSIPFGGSSWVDQRCQFLYIPGEFGTVPSGLITTIYFRSSGSAASTYTNLQIDVGQTSIVSLTGTSWVTGLTTAMVASSYSVTPTVGGWVAYPLQTPVYFDPTMSLVVDTRQTATTGGYAIYTASVTGNRRQYAASAATAPGAASATRYDIGFDLITCQPVTNVAASNITINSATLSWTGVSGSLGYEVKVDQNPAPPASGTFNASTSYNATGLSLNSTYYFHVRNICSNGYAPWVNMSFTTLNAYCLPPNNILFSNITNTTVDLLWSKMPTSDWYQYLVNQDRADPAQGSPVVSTAAISAFIQNLNPGEKYFVHMRSFCLGGSDSSYWKVDSFVTKQFCGAPQVVASGIGTNSISASWPAVPDAVAYEYVVNSVQADPAFGQQITATSINNISLEADGKNKYLHVRTKCNSQFSFSEWVTEPLRLVPDNIEDIALMPEIEVYPNPANEVLVLTVHGFTKGNNATIIVADITGRVLSKVLATGSKNYIDLKGLSSGVYVVKYVEDGITTQSLFQKK